MPSQTYPSYPGDPAFDELGTELFADYETAEHPPDAGMGRWFGRTEYDWLTGICSTLTASIKKHKVEWRQALNEWRVSVGKEPIQWTQDPEPPVTECPRPLQGEVFKKDKLWHDATGIRRILFDSQFNLLRKLRDDPNRYDEFMDETVRYRYQGRRLFLSVGGWTPYWDGHEIVPVAFTKWFFSPQTGHLRPAGLGPTLDPWFNYDDLLARVVEDHARRKLKLHVTCGDSQIILPDADQEMEFHRRCARIVKAIDPTVVALWECRNEYPLNGAGGDSAAAINQMGRVLRAVKEILPNVLTTQGSALSEEPAKLTESIQGGDICAVHVTRDPFETCLKHTFGLIYWEGNWRAFPAPYMAGEPKGPNAGPWDGLGDDAYQPSSSLGEMIALHGMAALCGIADNYFTGASVKGTDFNQNALGYKEIPELFEQLLPEDVTLWTRETSGGGAILYWTNGKDFRAATYRAWNTTPPRPVAEWTLYGDTVTSGTGTPPQGTGLLVGKFQ